MMIPSNLIAKAKENKLVIFIGAGLSMSCGLPNWNKLTIEILEGLREYEDKCDKYINAINDDIMSPVDVLQKIDRLKVNAIEILEKVIRSHDDKLPSTTHQILGSISTKIITTNYDTLLEKQYKNFEVVSYSNQYKVSRISGYDKYIFKLHGDINEPDKCIYFPSQYDELYNANEQASIFELKKIITDKSILFLGFSLSDPYINHVMDFIGKLYNGYTQEHFIISTQEIKVENVRLTSILIDSYGDLENKLNQIKDSVVPLLEIHSGENEKLIDVPASQNFDDYDIEIPPTSKFWVGRKKEIQNLSVDFFKVIFITGIGGQGKSALASYILKDAMQKEKYEFVDWRDFKEETNRFQTKLISLIQRLTHGDFNIKEYDSISINELIDIFFKNLLNRRILFVFDNIDSYIDLEYFTPLGSMKYFFDQAQSTTHNSKFIFTCRPFIREAGSDFYQIKLDGLSESECLEIFELYKVSVNKVELAELSNKSYQLTKGHPLWINLIAAQALRGVETVNAFIKSIEDKTNFNEEAFSSILSEKILNEVWSSLNDKQRNLLRGIAESVKPETILNLKKIMESELNSNQFDRAFKVLKNLNLIEIKSSSDNADLVELHPLVKEFIISKFPPNERSKFITLLVQYYDKFIYILKPRLNDDLNFSDFQNWMSKVELHINNEDYVSALSVLEEVSSPILTAGYTEEYLRVSEKLFSSIKFKIAIDNEYPYFHGLFFSLTTTLIQFGMFDKSEYFLDEYAKVIPGKGNHFLSYCSEKCFFFWFQEKYAEAIEIGEYGVHLLDESGISDISSLRHNLALAYRDSGKTGNIELALNHFLRGEKLENILNKTKIELGGHFYGNVGKCLELLGDKENALTCYFISFDILVRERNSYAILNTGYAASWIFNLLKSSRDRENSLYFYNMALNSWEKTAPSRANRFRDSIDLVSIDSQIKLKIENLPKWKIDSYCKEFAESGMQRGFVGSQIFDKT
ncbi:SIR2 family protein [Acinetobacter sp. NIPH 298]|uniref:SIR2 family protein n=1 Tax=Acinetobacter sp. NIPH 298 TaxID=1217692 RepID=UPI0005581CE3|nr:SIR2 family protein [Acinetobacter sp. NIPH 298]